MANAMIEDTARNSGIPFAIVRPTMYLDNLLKPSARAEIFEQGVFAPPMKASQRIAWTSAADCARATIMLLERGVYGGDYRIAGPESLSGHELAERITAGLRRAVTYQAQPLDEFERDVDAAIGPGTGRRIASKFRYFARHRGEADPILATPYQVQSGLEHFRPSAALTWIRRHREAFVVAGP